MSPSIRITFTKMDIGTTKCPGLVQSALDATALKTKTMNATGRLYFIAFYEVSLKLLI